MINYPRPPSTHLEERFPNARKGAVLVLFYPVENRLHTVLTLRHSYEGAHSGQVSFPGGSMEEDDESLWHTALREAHEEIGLDISRVKRIGTLSQVYIPPSNFLVTPYVAGLQSRPAYIPDSREVARIIEAPILHLFEEDRLKEKDMYIRTMQREIAVKYFALDGETVWGATGMMLNELKHILWSIDARYASGATDG